MEERANDPQQWYLLEDLLEKDGVWSAHLLVRWDAMQEMVQAEEGERIEYQYTAQRIVVSLPSDVQDRNEAIIYIENAKRGILVEAQKQLAREAV